MERQTKLAVVSTLGSVMPLYILLSYYSYGLQSAVREWTGARDFLAAHRDWIPVYDAAEATILASISILIASSIFLLIAQSFALDRLLRGWLAALPVLATGSALGRYLHNPSSPMPGLVVVMLTIFSSASISIFVAFRQRLKTDLSAPPD